MASNPKSLDTRLGQVLIRNKACSLREVNEALARQRKLKASNQPVPLGRILIESAAISEPHLREALAELGALVLACAKCGTDRVLKGYDVKKDADCGQCGAPLELVDPRPQERRTATTTSPDASPAAANSSVGAPGPGGASAESGATPGAPVHGDSFMGKILGGCQITEKIASGGMGVVYKAVQLNLGRTVAIKVLSEDLSKDENFVDRFKQEARAAAQLSHGGIVHINFVDEQQGVFFFVMEFVEGKNLREILGDGDTLGISETVEIMIQVCKALRHAHSRGVIHRDIKPENIMITHDGVVKLADLGLAKRVSEKSGGITHAGSVLGTPFYMAPEQAKDFSKVDQRSDVYSLGVTIYRVVTSKLPFYGRSPIEVMIKAIDGKKTPMSELREDVPQQLEDIVDRMMHKLPENRYQSVDGVLEDLLRMDVALKSGRLNPQA